MVKTARQFNKIYIDYKKKFKKPIQQVLMLMLQTFSDGDIVNIFKELYPHMWDDLNKQYNFWHNTIWFCSGVEKRAGIILESHIILF